MKNPPKLVCGKCHESKPVLDFHEILPSGELHPWCHDCLRKQLLRNIDLSNKLKLAPKRPCNQCGITFSVNSFHWIKSSKTRHSYCRACHAVYMAMRYQRVKVKN
jgi:hypothetical protein